MKIKETKTSFVAIATEDNEGNTCIKEGDIMGKMSKENGKFFGATVCMIELVIRLSAYYDSCKLTSYEQALILTTLDSLPLKLALISIRKQLPNKKLTEVENYIRAACVNYKNIPALTLPFTDLLFFYNLSLTNKNNNMKTKKMSTKKLAKFFENNGFNVHLFKQDKVQVAELEIWTEGGVDMIICLNPFTKEEFISYVDDFDVDEEIRTFSQDKAYCAVFTLRQSLEDFEEFEILLKDIAEKLNAL